MKRFAATPGALLATALIAGCAPALRAPPEASRVEPPVAWRE